MNKVGHKLADFNWPLIAVLLLGALFRWTALEPMNDLLHFDEAHNGIDVLALLRSPKLTPFFPRNFGREGGWFYCLAPFIAVFGASPFALRLASTMTGVLTLAALYRLGCEILGRRGATWATAALSVLNWHVHLSYLGLRAILLPLIGALAFASLLRAHRTNVLSRWIVGGLELGLLAYTYFSARVWMIYAFVLLVWWALRDRKKRRGILAAVIVAMAVSLPLLLYTCTHPQEALNRPGEVGVFDRQGIRHNLELWAKAWFHQGGLYAKFNLPGRPILDPYLGILFLVGLVSLPFVVRQRWHGLWLVGWAFFAVLPSVVSDQAPNYLRAIGLTLPIALVAGMGARVIERGVRRVLNKSLAFVLPLVLLTVAGVAGYRDFLRWMDHPEVFGLMEGHVTQAINFVKAATPDEMPVYFSPFSPLHPVLYFREADLAPRQVGAFDSHHCLVVSDVPATYVSLTLYEPLFEQTLLQWADTTVLWQDANSEGQPRYTIFQTTPHLESLVTEDQRASVFGDALRLSLLSPLPSKIEAGQTLSFKLGLRALRPLDRVYSVFVHLYGEPTPYEGGPSWAQGDSWLCASYSTVFWHLNETVIQEFELPVPADVPSGHYVIAVGVYESPAGDRLPLTAPAPQQWDYSELHEIEIGEANGGR